MENKKPWRFKHKWIFFFTTLPICNWVDLPIDYAVGLLVGLYLEDLYVWIGRKLLKIDM